MTPQNPDSSRPLVSVVTPTWNRAAYLQRVWEGLCRQTYRNFEWIVANDGSTDATDSLVRALAARSDFRIELVTASVHIGKARMDNEAVARARGELVVWNDSDDYLLPEALRELVDCWQSVPAGQQDEFVAVTAFCATTEGRVLNESGDSTSRAFDSTWNDLAHDTQFSGDMVQCVRASALKACPFPEVDFVVPESAVWSSLGDRKVRVLNRVVKMVEYRAPHAISFAPHMEYCRGRAHALAISTINFRGYPAGLGSRLRRLVTFLRYSIHGEIPLAQQRRIWSGWTALWTLAYPLAALLALKDRLQRKVRYTHRDFEAARRRVTVAAEVLSQPPVDASAERTPGAVSAR